MLRLASSGRSDVCVRVFGRRKTSIVCCLFMSDCNLVLCWVFSWLICAVDFCWMYVNFQMPDFLWDVIYD